MLVGTSGVALDGRGWPRNGRPGPQNVRRGPRNVRRRPRMGAAGLGMAVAGLRMGAAGLPHPDAFFCGLASEPARQYMCAVCLLGFTHMLRASTLGGVCVCN